MRIVIAMMLMSMSVVVNASLVELTFDNGWEVSFDTTINDSVMIDGVGGIINDYNYEVVGSSVDLSLNVVAGLAWKNVSLQYDYVGSSDLVDVLQSVLDEDGVFTFVDSAGGIFNGNLTLTGLVVDGLEVTAVPAPGAFVYLFSGLMGMGVMGRRRSV